MPVYRRPLRRKQSPSRLGRSGVRRADLPVPATQEATARDHPTSPSLGNTDPRSSRNPQRITGISSNPGRSVLSGPPQSAVATDDHWRQHRPTRPIPGTRKRGPAGRRTIAVTGNERGQPIANPASGGPARRDAEGRYLCCCAPGRRTFGNLPPARRLCRRTPYPRIRRRYSSPASAGNDPGAMPR